MRKLRKREENPKKQKNKKSIPFHNKSIDENVENQGYSSTYYEEVEKDKAKREATVKKDGKNREIIHITYLFVGLFVLVIGYFSYFMIAKSNEVINNPYNKRQDLLAEHVIRGKIISADGATLAETVVDDNGNETRLYPYRNMYSHIVGRVSKGKTGIESTENFHLLTSNDNAFVQIFNELSGEKNIGDNVVTTLETKLQEVAYDALGDQKGAVVVMDPSSGKILAMVSKPDYDPNEISSTWNELVEDKENNSALINRATQGLYPPGSIFKILTVLEYMRENPNYENYTYNCTGEDVFNGVKIHCYKNERHGEVDIKESFSESCNTSFANMGTKIDMKSFRELCDSFLFNSSLPTNLVYNPSSFTITGSSNLSEMPQTVIGQGKTQITPLHAALITSTIANGGVMMKPYVVDHVENVNGTMVQKYLPEINKTLMTPEEAQILTSYMAETVETGTAYALSGKKYTAAGKTGTAEHQEGKRPHSWFVGFAPVEKPEIVVSIIVESSGTGSSYAVPIASKIFDTYFE